MVGCFDSITALLQYTTVEKAFRFLHVLTNRVRRTGATAHYHLIPGTHDEQALATLGTLFDARIDATAGPTPGRLGRSTTPRRRTTDAVGPSVASRSVDSDGSDGASVAFTGSNPAGSPAGPVRTRSERPSISLQGMNATTLTRVRRRGPPVAALACERVPGSQPQPRPRTP